MRVKITVEVLPKEGLADPQGAAVEAALGRLGVVAAAVHVGRLVVFELDGAELAGIEGQAREAAARVLANPVIEDVVAVRVEPLA